MSQLLKSSILSSHLLALILLVKGLCLADDYLPKKVDYDKSIPSPEEFLGFEVGSRHILHHELVGYMRKLAEASNRVSIKEYAETHGGRPLVMLTITSPKNHEHLDSIRETHLKLVDPEQSDEVDFDEAPAVLNMGYGVHGNEPSASNVTPLVAYHLAAAKDSAVERLLEQVVVLLDPCLNPEGMDRFANWANNHKGRVLNPDPAHREHSERWPSGRTNYYWFDLNRDWLPAQHPESRGRLALFQRWRPNVVLDFHEMGTNSTYFFQPGVPQRTHPLTPAGNVALTRRMADYHAKALDSRGTLYYTQENFDDYYMGKGSTYPDLHGAVGILFEQASSRGLLQESENGPVSFPFTIRNQLATSLSSLEATLDLRPDLLRHQRDFYRESLARAEQDEVKGYAFQAPGDPARLNRFVEVLLHHGIEVHRLGKPLSSPEGTFPKDDSYLVLTAQPEYLFLKALFEKRTEFPDPVFYDVSTWTLPLAFDLDYVALKDALPEGAVGDPVVDTSDKRCSFEASDEAVAYVVDWRSYMAPRLLYRLLDAEVLVKVAHRPFEMTVDGVQREFGYGTLIIPLAYQPDWLGRDRIEGILRDAARCDGTRSFAVETSLSPAGIDLGSPSIATIEKPRVLLVTGEGVSSYEAGEVWHLLDQRFGMPVTMVDTLQLDGIRFNDYSAVVLVSGSYSPVSDSAESKLKSWVRDGGTLLAVGSSINWLRRNDFVDVALRENEPAESDAEPNEADDRQGERKAYADARRHRALRSIPGSILRTELDLSHPVCFGYGDADLPVFRGNEIVLEPPENPYVKPIVYANEPLLSGYISTKNLKRLGGAAGVVVEKTGRGRAILMSDNPNFRAFWYGTNRLFFNSIFFGPLVDVPSAGE